MFPVVATVRIYAAIFFKPLSSSTSDSSLLTNRFWGREWASSSVSYLDKEQKKNVVEKHTDDVVKEWSCASNSWLSICISSGTILRF